MLWLSPLTFGVKSLLLAWEIGKGHFIVHILTIVSGCGTRVEPFYLRTKNFIPIWTKSFSRFKIECDTIRQMNEVHDNDK